MRPRAAKNTYLATVQPSHKHRGASPRPPGASPRPDSTTGSPRPGRVLAPQGSPRGGQGQPHSTPIPCLRPGAWSLSTMLDGHPRREVGWGGLPRRGHLCPVQAALRPPPGPVPSRQRRQQPDTSAQVHPLQVPHLRCPTGRSALQPGTAHPAPWASGLQAKGLGQVSHPRHGHWAPSPWTSCPPDPLCQVRGHLLPPPPTLPTTGRVGCTHRAGHRGHLPGHMRRPGSVPPPGLPWGVTR